MRIPENCAQCIAIGVQSRGRTRDGFFSLYYNGTRNYCLFASGVQRDRTSSAFSCQFVPFVAAVVVTSFWAPANNAAAAGWWHKKEVIAAFYLVSTTWWRGWRTERATNDCKFRWIVQHAGVKPGRMGLWWMYDVGTWEHGHNSFTSLEREVNAPRGVIVELLTGFLV